MALKFIAMIPYASSHGLIGSVTRRRPIYIGNSSLKSPGPGCQSRLPCSGAWASAAVTLAAGFE